MKYPRPRGFKDGENAVICQYTGFRVSSSEVTRDYNGVIVRRRSADYQHPQETAPITHEDSVPEISNPRQINFVDVEFIEDPSQERPSPPAPISCTVALTGDIAAMFGEPLDIAGQVVSKVVPESPAGAYLAGGPYAPVSWAGWRGVGYQASDFTTSAPSRHGIQISDDDISDGVMIAWLETNSSWVCTGSGIAPFFFSGTATSKVGLRVDGETGDVEVIVDGVIKTKADEAGLGGMLAGLTVSQKIMIGTPDSPSLTEGDTYSAQVFTAAEDLADVGFPAGTLDWCGNEIPVTPPAPSCSITLTGVDPDTSSDQPLDISGQTVSKSDGWATTPKYFSASGPAVPLWAEGPRAIGYQASQFTETQGNTVQNSQRFSLVSNDYSEHVWVDFKEGLTPQGYLNFWSINTSAGFHLFETKTDPFSKVALRVDGATGDVEVIIDGDVYDKSTIPGLAGLFTKPFYPAVRFWHRWNPTVYEATVYTSAADLASFDLPAGTLDWCGNPI